jgi:septal ring factor EnvC (AmiA/AmiB activator)
VWHLLSQGREASAPAELFGVSEQLAAALAWADTLPATRHIGTLAAAVRSLMAEHPILKIRENKLYETEAELLKVQAAHETTRRERDALRRAVRELRGENLRLTHESNGRQFRLQQAEAALAALKEEYAQTESYVRQLEAAIRMALESPAMMGSEDIDALAAAVRSCQSHHGGASQEGAVDSVRQAAALAGEARHTPDSLEAALKGRACGTCRHHTLHQRCDETRPDEYCDRHIVRLLCADLGFTCGAYAAKEPTP